MPPGWDSMVKEMPLLPSSPNTPGDEYGIGKWVDTNHECNCPAQQPKETTTN